MGLLRRTKASSREARPATAKPATEGDGKQEPAGKQTGKGRPTPKRQRAAPPPPPPTSRKEAYARLKELSHEQREKARRGMAEGDDRYVLPRDKGPARRLVRDIVDARRNAGSYGFAVALVIILLTSSGRLSPIVRIAASYLWLAILLALCLDSLLLGRIISRAVRGRFPEDRKIRSHYLYGIMRALTFRRMRSPRPQVKIGESV